MAHRHFRVRAEELPAARGVAGEVDGMTCPQCKGSGQVTILEAGYLGYLRDPATVYADTCTRCSGTGVYPGRVS